MSDLISRSELLKHQNLTPYGMYVVYVDSVESAPTVDAVEVVHARWIPCSHGCFECSNCRCSEEGQSETGFPIAGNNKEQRFCPYCGARMDAKEGETE